MLSNPFENFYKDSGLNKKYINIQSELEDIDGKKKEIKIELMNDGKPITMAFFDIDGTLAHLSMIHGKAIQKLFPDQEPNELEETYYKGFRLGNSFREFDRMKGIYTDGHTEWKDPEFYFKNRLSPKIKEIDEPGNIAHDIAADLLKEYGEAAAQITEDLYKSNGEEFEKANIQPIFVLAKMYAQFGIPMVGFTANAKVFVKILAKYLKLSEIFLDIATDETMAGGGKEIAIKYLINKLESKGMPVPKNRLTFVGDSLRGDIGSSLVAQKLDKEISGQGILVLKNKAELIQTKKQINDDPKLKAITTSMNVFGLMVENVPLNQDGKPILLERFFDQFLEKL